MHRHDASPVPTNAGDRVRARLRALRAARRVTLEQVAERAGLPIDTVGRVERGVTSPSLRTLERIATGLGVDVVELVEPSPTAPGSVDWLAKVTILLERRTPEETERAYRVLAAMFDVRR